MTVVLKISLPTGQTLKCDSRCHDATGPTCHCICGGINHGVGYVQAKKNIKSIIDGKDDAIELLKDLKTGIEETYPTEAAKLLKEKIFLSIVKG